MSLRSIPVLRGVIVCHMPFCISVYLSCECVLFVRLRLSCFHHLKYKYIFEGFHLRSRLQSVRVSKSTNSRAPKPHNSYIIQPKPTILRLRISIIGTYKSCASFYLRRAAAAHLPANVCLCSCVLQ